VAATDLIAGLADDRVLVVGSLPPRGRDLDLLVRPPEAESIAAGLAAAGYERRGRIWARFEDCGADVVDIAPAEAWRLPDEELAAVFAEARPIEPEGLVCRPAPHHMLLVLARRAMREGTRLSDKRRERVAAELAEDADAFERAAERAGAWRADHALAALQNAFRDGAPIPTATRRRAVAVELAGPLGAGRATIASWRAVLRRPRRGPVIAFSGLDGSGKSSQAAALVETLERLGIDATMAWTSVAYHPPWLSRAQRGVKRTLTSLLRRGGKPVPPPAGPDDAGAPRGGDDPAKALRGRSELLTFAWSMTVTVLLASEVVRHVWPARLRGRVVVCDRHLLDAWAHLLYQYGEDRGYRAQLAVLRRVFPRPLRGYLLEVAPETASGRKQEYDPAQNARRAAIYRRVAADLGVTVIDGERPIEEICAEIAREVWSALR
jgi:thymidylate kinase